MRWLALCLLLLLLAVAAHAEAFVIVEPPVVRTCRTHKTWEQMSTCLEQHGTLKTLRSGKGLRLVHIVKIENTDRVDMGVYLVLERAGAWHIGGMYSGGSTSFELLAFEPLTIGKHTGHRMELGVTMTSTISPDDGATTIPALWRLRRTLYCAGTSYGCPDATLSCEVLVRGKAVFTFRGRAELDHNSIWIRGDRSKAGPCAPADRVFHGWPTTKE
jgi:hypothetical protein